MNMLKDEYFTGDSVKSPIEISGKKPSIKELVAVLRQFSKVLELANSQNPELSNVVGKLANILSRYKDKPVDDVLDGLTIAKRIQSVKPLLKARISESEVRFLTLEQIEKLLESEELSKSDLITIAVLRFGISKAELMKTKKTSIIEGIRTAISNLRTIEIIGKQASGDKQIKF